MDNLLFLENMLIYLPTLISCIYVFFKGMQTTLSFRKTLFLIFSNILNIYLTIIVQKYNYLLARLLFIILIVSICIISSKKENLIIATFCSAISLGISYSLRMVSIFITGFLFSIVGYSDANIIIEISVAIFQLLLSVIFINTRRFSKCFRFIQNKENYGIALFISSIAIVISSTISQPDIVNKSLVLIYAIGLILSFLGLFLWIRKSITEHYRKKLQARADEHYQNTLSEKEQQIEHLNNSNAFLSKIVHRDNHIMSSLQHTITKYKVSDNPNEREKLLNEILTLAQERSDLIVKEQVNTKVLPTTGISLIDGALSNMYIKATAHNIDFNLIINQDIHYLVNNLITQTDLETLLCDHIKDAIIAINSSEVIRGKILVTITMNDDIYEISIKDNGVDFEVDTLAKLGLERVTTHKNTGGSGIGFMTTFETLKKSNASLIITEYKTKTPFSKSITFRFDGLNAFIINSYRADLLKQSINRDDIVIM